MISFCKKTNFIVEKTLMNILTRSSCTKTHLHFIRDFREYLQQSNERSNRSLIPHNVVSLLEDHLRSGNISVLIGPERSTAIEWVRLV